jgi:hypothetical protein
VIPDITESHGKRLDSLITAFKEAVGGFNTRMDKHEDVASERHTEIVTKLDKIDKKIPEKKDG